MQAMHQFGNRQSSHISDKAAIDDLGLFLYMGAAQLRVENSAVVNKNRNMVTAMSKPFALINKEFFKQKITEKLEPQYQPYIRMVDSRRGEKPIRDSYGRVTYFYARLGRKKITVYQPGTVMFECGVLSDSELAVEAHGSQQNGAILGNGCAIFLCKFIAKLVADYERRVGQEGLNLEGPIIEQIYMESLTRILQESCEEDAQEHSRLLALRDTLSDLSNSKQLNAQQLACFYCKDIATARGFGSCEEQTVQQILTNLPNEQEIGQIILKRERDSILPKDNLFRQGNETIGGQLEKIRDALINKNGLVDAENQTQLRGLIQKTVTLESITELSNEHNPFGIQAEGFDEQTSDEEEGKYTQRSVDEELEGASLRYPYVVEELDKSRTMRAQAQQQESIQNLTPRTGQLRVAQTSIRSQTFVRDEMASSFQQSPIKPDQGLQPRNLFGSIETNMDFDRVDQPQPKTVQAYQNAKDEGDDLIDMNSVDFMSEVLSLDASQVLVLANSDRLKCKNEDQVVDFVRDYVNENAQTCGDAIPQLVSAIRFDFVSKQKLIELSLDPRLNTPDVVKALVKRLAQGDPSLLPADMAQASSQNPRFYTDSQTSAKVAPKIVVKRKSEMQQKPSEPEANDSEDSFDRGENPKRDFQTSTFVKSELQGSYYQIVLNYVTLGDKYLLTIKDITKKSFLCKKQEMPREFALYQVPVEDLDDPSDVMRTLKKRLEAQIRESAHTIQQTSPDSISRAFFQNYQQRKCTSVLSQDKPIVQTTNDPNDDSPYAHGQDALPAVEDFSFSEKSEEDLNRVDPRRISQTQQRPGSVTRTNTLKGMRDNAEKTLKMAQAQKYDYTIEDQPSVKTAESQIQQNIPFHEMSKEQLLEYIMRTRKGQNQEVSPRSQSPFSLHSRSGGHHSQTRPQQEHQYQNYSQVHHRNQMAQSQNPRAKSTSNLQRNINITNQAALRDHSPHSQNQMLQQNNQAVSQNIVSGMVHPRDANTFARQAMGGNTLANYSSARQRVSSRGPPTVYTSVPEEFVYDPSSQETGALHYLGTLGYSEPWQNPDKSRKQVRSFASSLNHGRPSDIIGLNTAESHTETGDVPFSFMGIQLMYGRRLIPSTYTLRTVATHQQGKIMRSWRLDASNDLVNWVTIDARYGHLHSQAAFAAICKPGNTTTWGIDSAKYYAENGNNGFCAFRIVQIDENTERTHNMNLSGLEIYGRPANPELWTF